MRTVLGFDEPPMMSSSTSASSSTSSLSSLKRAQNETTNLTNPNVGCLRIHPHYQCRPHAAPADTKTNRKYHTPKCSREKQIRCVRSILHKYDMMMMMICTMRRNLFNFTSRTMHVPYTITNTHTHRKKNTSSS